MHCSTAHIVCVSNKSAFKHLRTTHLIKRFRNARRKCQALFLMATFSKSIIPYMLVSHHNRHTCDGSQCLHTTMHQSAVQCIQSTCCTAVQCSAVALLHCTLLHCTALYCNVYCITFYHAILNCNVLHCKVLWCAMLYYALRPVVPHHQV